MNVHIICTSKNKDGILWRMSAALANATGWSLSPHPKAPADLNYYICYIDVGEKYTDWHLTPVSAWFTHYESETPFKKYWWDTVSESVDLRLTSAAQYADMLRLKGPTAIVTPFIERERFTIAKREKHTAPVVGLSGFVHPGGRKGERLAARLAGSKLGQKIHLVASGKGWPVQTRAYDWETMHEFYQGLDVLLCTATTEGIPAPPLEALACGVPVVIPRGVGLLDDLPDIPGIVRYQAGDYDAMQAAVQEAIGLNGIDREALRAATEPYTLTAWAETHRAAFEAFLQSPHDTYRISDSHGMHGAYYVAYGDPARKCAAASIASFKQYNPDTPVCLASVTGGLGEDVHVPFPDKDIGGRSAKLAIDEVAPKEWSYLLYLDADTEITADLSPIFNILAAGWDMVICKDLGPTAEKMRRKDNGDEMDYTLGLLGTAELLPLNGGVFAFTRNERTAAFFKAWQAEWARWGKRDQGALLRALWAHPVKLFVLGNEWNTLVRYQPRESTAGILHYSMTARRYREKIYHRLDSKEAWSALEQQGVRRDQ